MRGKKNKQIKKNEYTFSINTFQKKVFRRIENKNEVHNFTGISYLCPYTKKQIRRINRLNRRTKIYSFRQSFPYGCQGFNNDSKIMRLEIRSDFND